MSLLHTGTRIGSRLGIFAVLRSLSCGRGSHVLTLHGTCSGRRQGLPSGVEPSFAADELDGALGWIGERFRFLTPERFFRGESRGVLLTFDDGFKNNVHVALPILERHEAPAVFFVTVQHVLEPRNWLPATRRQSQIVWDDPADVPEEVAVDLFDGMSADELRTAARHPLVTIGSHTVSHPFLTRLSTTAARDELSRSRRQLEEWTGDSVDLLAYPTGDYDLRIATLAREAGYRAAFVERSRHAGLPEMEVPRIGLYSHDPSYLGAKLCGLHSAPVRRSALGEAA